MTLTLLQIANVVHASPWIPGMYDAMPAGTLVYAGGSTQNGSTLVMEVSRVQEMGLTDEAAIWAAIDSYGWCVHPTSLAPLPRHCGGVRT